MIVYLLIRADEYAATIERAYSDHKVALKSLMGHPNTDSRKWGLAELELKTIGELLQEDADG